MLPTNVNKSRTRNYSLIEELENEHQVRINIDHKKIVRDFEERTSKAGGLLDVSELEALVKGLNKILYTKSLVDEWLNMRNAVLVNELDTETWDIPNIQNENVSTQALDFHSCLSLLCFLQKRNDLQMKDAVINISNEWLPLDPETKAKQVWDLFCMLLLVYCSFSVPYSIAFMPSDSTRLTPMDYSDIAIDIVFMIDISLTFVTKVDIKGVTEVRIKFIAIHYLSTWFFPDLAGSFPFDLVIAAIMGPGGNLGAMKLIRMVRLVRAAKFINKLNKLKEREGMEAFGAAIGISSAMFILIFSAHFLGCFFTLLAGSESDKENWVMHYNPDLVDADDVTRYILALYWAVISLTTMGYGDVVPVTHFERMFAIIVALIGAVVFSHCMGTISSLIIQVAGVEDRCQVPPTHLSFTTYRSLALPPLAEIR